MIFTVSAGCGGLFLFIVPIGATIALPDGLRGRLLRRVPAWTVADLLSVKEKPRRVAVRGARLHRPGSEVNAVRLRYHSRAVPCRVAGAPGVGAHRRLELELGEPFHGAAPGQAACLLRGDVIVGWATITA